MILTVLAIALIIRFVAIGQSLWLDEAINVNNAAGLDFKSLVTNYSLSDFHPPIYHVILKAWILLVGKTEIAVRIPSIIFGVASVYVTYLIAKKLFEEKTARIAATLIATSPLAIYYSQEARMYSLAAMTASLSVYFFLSLLKKDSLLMWMGFIISTVLMLYTDYLPYLLIPIYILYLLINKKVISKNTFKTFIPAIITIFISLVPWLILLPSQLQTGLSTAAASPAWAQVVGSSDLKSLALTFVKFTIGRISHDNDLIYALLFAPIGLFVAFLFGLSLFRLSRLRSFLHYWLFGVIILAFAISSLVPIYAYFRLLFILPAFYLVIASGVNTINWPPLTRTLLVLFLAINLISSYIYFTNHKFQREDWRAATAYIHQNTTPQTAVIFESTHTVAPFDYYNFGLVDAQGALDSFSPDPQKVKARLKDITLGRDKVFLFQYLSQITDPQGLIFKELSLLGFVNISTKDFPGVGFVYEFKK